MCKNEVEVSILITAYNEENFIEKSVSSALSQNYNSFEVVVINDGSKDRTQDLLEDKFDDDRLRIFEQKNKGRIKSLNKGVKLSKGKFIAILDADDIAMKNRVKKQANFLLENKNTGVVGSSYIRNDKIRGKKYVRRYPKKDSEIKKEMSKYIPIAHSSSMIRKEAILQVGGYRNGKHGLEDMNLWIRIGRSWDLANLNEALVLRNIRNDSHWHSVTGRQYRNFQLAKLNARAIKAFSLSYYYYVFPLGRLVYSWLPVLLKRVARRLSSGIEERDLRSDPKDEDGISVSS